MNSIKKGFTFIEIIVSLTIISIIIISIIKLYSITLTSIKQAKSKNNTAITAQALMEYYKNNIRNSYIGDENKTIYYLYNQGEALNGENIIVIPSCTANDEAFSDVIKYFSNTNNHSYIVKICINNSIVTSLYITIWDIKFKDKSKISLYSLVYRY